MKRTHRLLLAALACLALAAPGSAAAAGSGVAADLVVEPGESIHAAVDAAQPGDTIHVERGVYRENVLITKDGLTIVGHGATLLPPATPAPTPCADPSEPESASGFCVAGEVDFATGAVSDAVEDVTIRGFTIRDFGGSAIFAFGTTDATFAHNRAIDNHEYGIFALLSTGTRITDNVANGSEEAGIYVGDSPDADALVARNTARDNLFGVFFRSALGGTVTLNTLTGNCVGLMVLADAPGPAGDLRVRRNVVAENDKACPATDEGPPLSGVGVALVGAHDVTVHQNAILGNNPSGETFVQGGVVVVSGLAGTLPTGNAVHGNVILRNDPDLFWDGTGTENDLTPNVCRTSVPDGLCTSPRGHSLRQIAEKLGIDPAMLRAVYRHLRAL